MIRRHPCGHDLALEWSKLPSGVNAPAPLWRVVVGVVAHKPHTGRPWLGTPGARGVGIAAPGTVMYLILNCFTRGGCAGIGEGGFAGTATLGGLRTGHLPALRNVEFAADSRPILLTRRARARPERGAAAGARPRGRRDRECGIASAARRYRVGSQKIHLMIIKFFRGKYAISKMPFCRN